MPKDAKAETPTVSEFLRTAYFLVLELPFDLLLTYQKSFSHLDDAENYLDNELPMFKIWTQEQFNAWGGKVLYVPLKKPAARDTYIFTVHSKIIVEADDPNEAHRKVHTQLGPLGFKDIRTVVQKARQTIGERYA